MGRILGRAGALIGTVVLLLGVPRLAGLVADLFSYQTVDPDGAYAWISVHHIVQALVFILLIALIRRVRPLDFRLGRGDVKKGLASIRIFTLIFLGYTAITVIVALLTGSFAPLSFPITARNVAGYLGFQLLLSGPSEELIFRAFAMTIFALIVPGRIAGGRVSHAGWIAAVVFGLAHVGFTFSPFSLSYTPFQVVYSIVLGLIYADVYEKTNSVYYPMVLHSISNVVMVTATIILMQVV